MNLGYFLTIAMWILAIFLQLLIATIMIRRGLVKQFKYFFAYCLCAPARDVALLFLQSYPNLYSWLYWIGEGLLIVLQVVVLCEVFWSLAPLHTGARALVTRVLKAALALSSALALVLFAKAVASSGESIEAILILERFARAVQVSMLVVAMIFISSWGLTWRHYATGILLGSGIVGLQLVPAELRGSLHLISNSAFVWLKPAVYDCAVIVWAVYFIQPQIQKINLPEVPQAELGQWDETLKGYLYR